MATGITFDEGQLHPTKTNVSNIATGSDLDQGIIFARSVSMSKNSTRARSMERGRRRGSRGKAYTTDEDDGETAMPADYRVKQTFKGRQLWFLAYQSIGVIYGDIGTSPLYVFSSTFTDDPSNEDLVGVLSLLIWSLLFMVTLKYVIIILNADNEGEGGTFSTYSLLARFANITNVDPKEKSFRMERYKTNDLPVANSKIRDGIEKSKILRSALQLIGVLAVSMVLSDGLLTPAQSVLGAVQGLNVVAPSITNGTVVGVTCAILVLLFLIQPLGTGILGSFFSPIVMIWLLLNGGIGIYNLVKYDYTVLRAFNPGELFLYLIRNKQDGWSSLGGVLLAFTGLEALFADLGAFSAKAIRMSWIGFVLPLLILTYAGQASYISMNSGAYANPVFNCLPDGWLIPMLIFAVLAAIVASQAIITASFQLISQIMTLSYLPQIKVVHTSKTHHTQLYVPLVNWLLMIGTVAISAGFNNTTSLGNAYGVCVMFVTFFDTIMVTLVSMIVWKIPFYFVILPALCFLLVDGTFLSSALEKVPSGAWFTICLSALMAMLFIWWRYGKEQQWFAEAKDRLPMSKYVLIGQDGKQLQLVQHDNEEISQIRGFGVFFDKVADKTPIVFAQFMEKLVVLPEISVFLNLRAVETPTIPDSERYWVTKMRLPHCYRLVIRHGYMDEVITPNLAGIVYNQLRQHILRQGVNAAMHDYDKDRSTAANTEHIPQDEKAHNVAADEQERSDNITRDIAYLDQAYSSRVLYVVGKQDMFVSKSSSLVRKFLLGVWLFVKNNTRNKASNLPIKKDRLVEIGYVKEI